MGSSDVCDGYARPLVTHSLETTLSAHFCSFAIMGDGSMRYDCHHNHLSVCHIRGTTIYLLPILIMDTQRTYIIGITGGIGSGKSTIVSALAQRGHRIYDCDREAKHIIATDSRVQQAIIDLLGAEAFCGTQYNTAYVAQRVFAEPALLQQLNAIVHPAVAQDILAVAQTDRERGALIVESAILYESGMDQLCDLVFWIDAPEELRLARTLARDWQGIASADNIKKVRARMRSQQATTYIAQRTQKPIVLINDGSRSISELADEICSYLN